MAESVTERWEERAFSKTTPYDGVFAYRHTGVKHILEAWDDDSIIIEEKENDDIPHHIFKTLRRQLASIDSTIGDIHQNRFIRSASSRHLEKLGEEVGTPRHTDETDEEYRIRVNTGYARAISDSTFETFARVVLNLFNADGGEIKIRGVADAPEIIVDVPLQYIEDVPLTEEGIVRELRESIPAYGNVRISAEGTFEFGGSDYDAPEGTGLNEGTLGYSFDGE